ncbi:MAG TPA: type III-A CRISPR-associated RAMP protein Csm3 [Candidatus Hydrogenedentes bacterium]|nr:type III-A CRISPR-associated RAMP protein Csm3 [Candidatus Hydrogenedentota bacterium]HOK90739.1 type III-A CRISPR-associated RAMP protein Csm3 [Candidatus Hydrogenedentota bacterium]HOV61575.1 type III-A CRISPR-associated RAMP protein Csm3 [Candidatus Hydrogenedentota bacterium]
MVIKMKDILEFKGTLQVTGSGLRIGGGKDNVGIGETDNPIIRHPITHRPYVPGSSVKGKIRSLLESRYCPDTQRTGLPCKCGECFVCQLFGCGDSKNIQSPSRLVFRDCQPTEETIRTWEEAGVDSEVKTEVLIDRNKGLSYGRIGPRTMERIPAGSAFDFAFSLRYFEGDNLREYLLKMAEGFELLEKHYLGGSGSRGYGQVRVVAADGKPMAEYLRAKAGA